MKDMMFSAGQTARDPVLDVFRALAIMLVIVCHGMNFFWGPKWIEVFTLVCGFMGVELFFVLSGFLVGGILFEAYVERNGIGTWIGAFWMRRWFRTLPNYYLFLTIEIGLEFLWHGRVPHFTSYIFLIQNFSWPISHFYENSWSLTIEELFYLSFPLVLLITQIVKTGPRKRFLLGCGLVLTISIALRSWAALYGRPSPSFNLGIREITIYRMDSLVIGALAYLAYRRLAGTRRRWLAAVGCAICAFPILAIAGAFGDLDASAFWKIWWCPIASIGCAVMLIGSLRPQIVPAGVARPAGNIARWSYSAYLVNSPLVISMLTWIPMSPSNTIAYRWVLFITYIALTFAIARTIYRWFEAPVMGSRYQAAAWMAGRNAAARKAVRA